MKSETEIKDEIIKLYKIAINKPYRSDQCYNNIELLEWVLQ